MTSMCCGKQPSFLHPAQRGFKICIIRCSVNRLDLPVISDLENKLFSVTSVCTFYLCWTRLSEPESGPDEDDKGRGRAREGADAPGAPRVAHPLPRAGQDPHPGAHLRNQNLHHHQNLRWVLYGVGGRVCACARSCGWVSRCSSEGSTP